MASFTQLLQQLEAAHSSETGRLETEINQLRAQLVATQSPSPYPSASSDIMEPIMEPSKEPKPGADLSKSTSHRASLGSARSKRDSNSSRKPVEKTGSMQSLASSEFSLLSSVSRAMTSVSNITPKLRGSFLYNVGIGLTKSMDEDAADIIENDGRCLGHLHLFVRGPIFESFFASLIFANAILMAVETQFESFRMESDLGLSEAIASNAWPNLAMFFVVMGWVFGILFTLEVAMKLVCLRLHFFCDAWNWIDSAIVSVWLIGSLEAYVGQTVRLFRLLRLMRLLRLVRTIQSFDSLYLMTTALKGSVSVLAWAACLLFVIHLLLALLFTQLLSDHYLANTSIELSKRVLVFEYFGSFNRSMFTMFQLTLGTWAEPSRILIDNVSEWFVVFALTFKLMIGFAAIGVINGVFMQETFKVAATDDVIMLRQKQRAMGVHAQKMRNLFDAVDQERRGYIDFMQFELIMTEPHVKTWLASMELSTDDIQTLYSLLDNGDDKLSVDELIAGVGHLKGTARSIDLAVLSQQVKGLEATIYELTAHTSGKNSRPRPRHTVRSNFYV